jgi:hypothetical protein
MVNSWKVILATLVIFGAGVITGGLLVNYSDRAFRHPPDHRVPEMAGPPMPGRPGPMVGMEPAAGPREPRLPPGLPLPLRKEFLNRLNRELGLTPAQHERIGRIVSEGQQRTRELWRIEWIETRQKIRAELTPEQQRRFEELFKARPRDQRRPPAPRDRAATNSPSFSRPDDPPPPDSAADDKL